MLRSAFCLAIGCTLLTALSACGAEPQDVDVTHLMPGMVDIEAGMFLMGCNEQVDDLCDADERPYHHVNLSNYRIDAHEVTQGEYFSCMRDGACRDAGTDAACGWDPVARAEDPVVCVPHTQAEAYCQWLGKRLPTEAEWERAARSTGGWLFPWGNDDADCSRANTRECNEGLLEVGSRPDGRSDEGVFDLAGNAGEWVGDWYSDSAYTNTQYTDPAGPRSGVFRVVRSGSSFVEARYARASNRGAEDPTIAHPAIGFRCAVDGP